MQFLFIFCANAKKKNEKKQEGNAQGGSGFFTKKAVSGGLFPIRNEIAVGGYRNPTKTFLPPPPIRIFRSKKCASNNLDGFSVFAQSVVQKPKKQRVKTT
eukprot:GEMP01097785.1.p3 GENE.GEMP01097785.1~~GEMP01097785.1.p3  ORF type:complete len:100 (-),score=6.80 GEMP01097785.1:100-399(-)